MPIRDHNPSGKFPIITILLITLNSIVFFYELTLPEPELEKFIATFALVPTQVDFFQTHTLYPFITSMFLHGGVVHLASNMLFLWVFGDNVEATLGKIKYLLFYILGGAVASLIQFLFIQSAAVPMLGASGAIAAVLGAYLVLYPNARIDVLMPIFYLPTIVAVPAFFMLIYWFITQLFSGIASVVTQTASFGGVAFLAHTAGFLVGALLIRLVKPKKPVVSGL